MEYSKPKITKPWHIHTYIFGKDKSGKTDHLQIAKIQPVQPKISGEQILKKNPIVISLCEESKEMKPVTSEASLREMKVQRCKYLCK